MIRLHVNHMVRTSSGIYADILCGYVILLYMLVRIDFASTEMEFESGRKFLIEKGFGLAGAGVRSIGSDGGRGERCSRPRVIFAL